MRDLPILTEILHPSWSKNVRRKAPQQVALAGFSKEATLALQLDASDIPIRLVGTRDCAQVCRLLKSAKTRLVVVGPALRPHDRVTIESVASSVDARTLVVDEASAVIPKLRTFLLRG